MTWDQEDGSYGKVISRFLRHASRSEDLTVFGDGSQSRSFCYVVDTVVGLLLLIRGTAWKATFTTLEMKSRRR